MAAGRSKARSHADPHGKVERIPLNGADWSNASFLRPDPEQWNSPQMKWHHGDAASLELARVNRCAASFLS